MKKSRAFTLVEIIVVLGIIGLFIGISVPFLQKTKLKNDLRSSTTVMVQWLRRAQLLAQSGSDDLGAGVYIQSGAMSVFRWDTYVTRLSEYDDVYILPSSVTFTGIQEIRFERVTGFPDTTWPIFILTSTEWEDNTINLNAKGIIHY